MVTIPQSALFTMPEAFLASAEGRQWLENLVEESWYRRYSQDYSHSYSLEALNSIASSILNAKYGHDNIGEDRLCSNDTDNYWWQAVRPQFNGGTIDLGANDEWDEALRDAWTEAACLADTSKPEDMFSRSDRCELMFRFTRQQYLEDALCYSNGYAPDFRNMVVDENFQFTLSQLGFTVTQYRKVSGNQDRHGGKLQPLRPARKPIISWENLEEMIDNACATSFIFTLYAIVPIQELFALDVKAPVCFNNCHAAVHDPVNGTFHDVPCLDPVTVMPSQGRFVSGADGYSPDEICGLVHSYYHGNVSNS